ncbi:hypothetical protein [Rhodobacter capsulatus]|jgi:hypothetical protein|uniref:Uncharacterized protein n=1 Tax=Rhodobacter capsulatus (strain ATCC BAA-309 / NBRC 16581 / SB1003) TaxID=272942 RepID=D5ASH0_RHOCB|nr:hypothetical protein [Rhodobacter capsulatus]ADE85061.1 hypothetical protein RCAP_rcc01310 [Rhodobacter capsulatus SB 1003]ETD02177.1 hypothetical protein U714_07760 [Rhodobacter capsulatus DE442]ETD77867.1 hypothetical protein U717_07935 [Rhodobacter capsulatus R121]ETE54210.1 hypothetical protein U715_07935 [Rhodobacter capsulatus Y262]MDS0926714.1 hypothetical protein [Rhodobacter capsulatus]
MNGEAKNEEKDEKGIKFLFMNDFFRFWRFRAMTLIVPRAIPGDRNDLHLTPENENAGMLAHPDVDVMWKAEAHQH